MTGRSRLIVPGILGVIVLIVGTLILLPGAGPSGQQITVRFDSSTGLIKGAEVRAGAVRVGTVEEVTLGADDKPEVTLRLEDDYVVHEGATADLRMLSQAGQLNRYVEMTSGSGRVLGDGAVLDLDSTDQPVDLDDALSTLTPEVRADVRSIVASLDRGLTGHGDDLSRALDHSDRALRETNELVADLAADGPALRRLVRESSALVSELAEDPQSLQAAADRLAGTLAVTARRQQELGQTVDGLGPGLRGARRALDELNATTPQLRALAKDAGPAAREIRRQAPTVRRLLEVAPEALEGAQDLTETAPAQLEAMLPLLREARPVVEQLPNALRQFAPVLDEMRARAPDALGWLPLLGDSLSNYDVNGHAARFMFIAEPAPDTKVGPTEQKPGKLAAPYDRVPGLAGGQPWLDFEKSFVGGTPWVAPENAKADAKKAAAAKERTP